jgi:hypothetical protein
MIDLAAVAAAAQGRRYYPTVSSNRRDRAPRVSRALAELLT